MRSLADEWQCDPSNATWIVDHLEELGLAQRQTVLHDRRVKLVVLTRKGQKIRTEPRALLGRIPGLRLVDLPESELCCGSAGVYNLLEPRMADRLLERKVSNIAATGATVLVAGNPGCLLQIAKGCKARGLGIETVHPVELLARAVRS